MIRRKFYFKRPTKEAACILVVYEFIAKLQNSTMTPNEHKREKLDSKTVVYSLPDPLI